jgi:hypothetical protein
LNQQSLPSHGPTTPGLFSKHTPRITPESISKFVGVGFWLSFITHLLNVTYPLRDCNNSITTFALFSYYLQERVKHHSHSLFHQTSKPARNQDAISKLLEAFKAPLPGPFLLNQGQCNYPILSIKHEYQCGASFRLQHSQSLPQYS